MFLSLQVHKPNTERILVRVRSRQKRCTVATTANQLVTFLCGQKRQGDYCSGHGIIGVDHLIT